MKSGEKPQFDSAWWTKNKAKALAKETALDKALAVFEKSFDAFRADPVGKEAELTKAQAALNALPPIIAATIKKCNSLTNKETIECLKKFDPLIKNLLRDMKSELNRRAQISKLTLEASLFGAFKAEFAKLCKEQYIENDHEYLVLMKGKTGTAKEYNKYIAPGSPSEINISDELRTKFCAFADKDPKSTVKMTPALQAQWKKTPRRDLSKAPWKEVYQVEWTLLETQQLVVKLRNLLRAKERMLASLR